MKNHQLPNRRPISGETIADFAPAISPPRTPLIGETAQLEPVDPQAHAADLFDLSHGHNAPPSLWRYLGYGPFCDQGAFSRWLGECAESADPLFFAIRDKASGQAAGMASYLNIHPEHGRIEIGHIWFAPLLQKTRPATEALFLLMRQAMDALGYRRLEWKCDALNEPSRRAAVRLGFRFEGLFYNHLIVKGRNRDTAWFSIIDSEWPAVRANFETWLAPDNFDAGGQQRQSLRALNQIGQE
jgi:RimJ/RimL family protein N-acetyltransferase